MIYRGFDIDKTKDGKYRVSLGVAVMHRGFFTEEMAMNWIDEFKRNRNKK